MKSALAKFYSSMTHINRQLYAKQVLKPVRISKKVLSVGNITFGGTGKTPFVKELVQELLNLGKHPAVVVRSYKASAEKSEKLSPHSLAAELGDEAIWYLQRLSVPIFSGPKKWESALLAEKEKAVDVVVVDDGFQHHKLYRDADLILIDALAGVKSLTEKARDSVRALSGVSAVILTRSNLVSSADLKTLRALIPSGPQVFLNQTQAVRLRNFKGEEIRPLKKVGLVCGIANPLSFQKVFSQKFPDVSVKTLNFSDHHDYSDRDLAFIEKFQKDNGLEQIIITEKDEVKLKNKNFDVLEIKSQFEDEKSWREFLNVLVG